MAEQYLGTATIIVNGTVLATMEGAKCNTGGFEREPVKANGKVVGWTRKVVEPSISGKFAAGAGFNVEEINAVENGSVVFKGDNGLVYQLDGACTRKPVEVSADNGGADAEWFGSKMRKL